MDSSLEVDDTIDSFCNLGIAHVVPENDVLERRDIQFGAFPSVYLIVGICVTGFNRTDETDKSHTR